MYKSAWFTSALILHVAWAGVAGAGNAPVEIPLFEQIQDVNPCTSELITLTLSGIALVHEVDDKFHLHGYGTVTTSDGFSGTFNRTLIFKGDQVVTLRFHDMEMSDATGEKIMFAVGLVHVTTVNGEVRSSVLHFSGPRCLGEPRT